MAQQNSNLSTITDSMQQIAGSNQTAQKETRGKGKEEQLQKISASVNAASIKSVSNTASISMLQSFTQALEQGGEKLVEDLVDSDKKLITELVNQIAKLQDKNIKEFEKSTNELVKLAEKIIKSGEESGNESLKNLGQTVKGKANEQLFSEMGIQLKSKEAKQAEIEKKVESGELTREEGDRQKSEATNDDTFKNRFKRMFAADEQIDKTTGVAKIGGFKGVFKNLGGAIREGAKEAGSPEGGIRDSLFSTDESKRNKILEEQKKESEQENVFDDFKKMLQDLLDTKKEDGAKDTKIAANDNPVRSSLEKLSDLTDKEKKVLEERGVAPASEKDFSYRKDGKSLSKEQIVAELQQAATEQQNTTNSQQTNNMQVVEGSQQQTNNMQVGGGSQQASSEQQEDKAGISKDAGIESIAGISATLGILQENSSDSLDVFKSIQEKITFISEWLDTNKDALLAGAAGGAGGGLLSMAGDIIGGGARGAGLGISGATLATGAAVAAGAAGVAYGAYKGYTGYQEAKKQEQVANAQIDEKVSRGELTQAQGVEEKSKTKKQGRVEKSKAVGEGAGIAAGAAGGAALGAMYGSALGPLGTAVGGVGGALVGGFVGGGGGKWLGEKAGQLSNWWNGDSDKQKLIDEKVKKGEISKAEADKMKKDLKPSGKDKVSGAVKGAAMGSLLGPVGMLAGGALGFFGQDKEKEQKPKAVEKKSTFGNIADKAKDHKGAIIGAALGPVGMAAGAALDYFSGDKKKAKVGETGSNRDGQIIEKGTALTKDKMNINVPAPTVINQGGGKGGEDKMMPMGNGGSTRSDDGTWLRFQKKRAFG